MAGWQGMTGSQAARQGTAGHQAPIKAPQEVILHAGAGGEGGGQSRR